MNGVLQQSGSGIAEPLSAVAQWEFDVRHATNGLSIKVCGLGDGPPVGLALAHGLWSLYWRRPVLRVVLELSDLKFSSPQVTLELVLFNRWIGKRGGVVRLCGLSRNNFRVVASTAGFATTLIMRLPYAMAGRSVGRANHNRLEGPEAG